MTSRIEFADFCGFPPHINLSGNLNVRELILEMVSEFENARLYSGNYINGLFSTWASIVARHVVLENKEVHSRMRL